MTMVANNEVIMKNIYHVNPITYYPSYSFVSFPFEIQS
jgi:hypothetical protein